MRIAPILPLLALSLPAWAWPSPSAWQPLMRGGGAVVDPVGDNPARLPADAHLDLVGMDAAAWWSADAQRIYFRAQVAGDPEQGIGLWPTTWAVLLDTDGDLTTAERALTITGPSGQIDLYGNPSAQPGAQPMSWEWLGTVGSRGAGDAAVSLSQAGDTWLLDWSASRADWLSYTGVGEAHRMRAVVVSGLSLFADWDDVAGCDNAAGPCALEDLWSDVFLLDEDGDGLTATQEAALGTASDDADSDDDGVADGDERVDDVDGDGLIGALDCDGDGDGLPDGLEAGVAGPLPDTRIGAGCFVPDADPASTTAPDLADTDGGGVDDGEEDWNRDGAQDAWETDPTDPTDDVDSDGDGIADLLELRGEDGEVIDVDSDGDGISDASEWLWDSDGDGVPNFLDDDSDGDGIPDAVEGARDPDEDGVESYLDEDSDGDGIPDATEGAGDTDGDTVPDFLDEDSDGDGTPDAAEGADDADCDGVADYVDPDDGDGPCGRSDELDPGTGGDNPLDGAPLGYGELTGGACSSGPLGAAWWVVLMAGLFVGRRAQAQEVDAQRFTPATDARTFVKLQAGEGLAQGEATGGAWLGWVDDPLVYRPLDDARDEVDVLGTAVGLDLAGSYGLGPVTVGASASLYPYAKGYMNGAFQTAAGPRFGDLRLTGTMPLIAADTQALSVNALLSLPTGAGLSWLGSKRARLGLGVAGQQTFGPLEAVLNLGFLTGAHASVGDALTDGARVSWGLGGATAVNDDLSVVAELDGELWLGAMGRSVGRPVELLLSARARSGAHALLTLGVGTGLSQGIGAPDARVVAGLQWVPGEAAKTPEVVRVPPPDVGTGHLVLRAFAPGGERVPKAEVRVIGTLGVPLQTGNDGLFEADLAPGSYEVAVTAPGWTTAERRVEVVAGEQAELTVLLRPTQVLVDQQAGRIYLHRKVFFELDRADLKIESLEVLDALIRTLQEHPEVLRLEVEGHTDSQGSDAHNLELSQARAQAVVDYLVREGVDADRLVAKGFGETRLLQEGDTEEVHATNRRVEFHILDLAKE